MAELPWFPLYARDWLSGEGPSMMLPEQEGAFLRLLCVAWADGAIEPSIPADPRALAQMSRLGARWKKLGALILAQFTERDGRLYNDRLSAIWHEQQERSRKLAENGRKGGRAKAGLKPGQPNRVSKPLANSCQSESESESESEVIDDDTTPAIPNEPELTALFLAICANKAITERWGEQIQPMSQGGAARLTQELQERHIGADIARLSIYRQCREKAGDPPSHMNYFLKGIIADADREATRIATASSAEAPPSEASARAFRGGRRGNVLNMPRTLAATEMLLEEPA